MRTRVRSLDTFCLLASWIAVAVAQGAVLDREVMGRASER
jgi:hypothetical protein